MRKTKIICTLGPAVDSDEMVRALIRGGMNAARFNFSHGDHASHLERLNRLKAIRDSMGRPVATILDTKGPEIRIKSFEAKSIELKAGDPFALTTEDVVGNQGWVSVTYDRLHEEIGPGQEILIDDGLVAIRVDRVEGRNIICTVENGGTLSANKSINIPGVHISLPALTERDADDIRFGVENDFDFIAASFVRRASDVEEIRRVLHECGGDGVKIIAKIENQEGVDNIDSILEVSDGIMVARGDLGVEIPAEEVPLVQKILIAKANRWGKPVITATQMLESMVNSPRPTRAEANDVANAIFDGSDAIMLSGETAMGNYPVEAVATMARIAQKAEGSMKYGTKLDSQTEPERVNITNAISLAACATAAELNTACICTITQSGFTARMIAKHRPVCPIVAGTPNERAWRQMNLIWGCKSLHYEGDLPKGGVFDAVMKIAERSGLVNNGDTVVLAMCMPVGVSGATNTLRVDIVGDILCKGTGTGMKKASGRARVIKVRDDMEHTFQKGDILVTTATDNSFMPYIQKASAIIVGPMDQNVDCHAQIAGSALDIPVIVCNQKVVDFVPNDALITVDAEKGFVYKGIPKR